MTPELEQYYVELFDMFESPGWQHYQEYVQKIHHQTVNKGWELPTGDQLLVNKGIVTNLELLKGFQRQHEAAFSQLQEDSTSE